MLLLVLATVFFSCNAIQNMYEKKTLYDKYAAIKMIPDVISCAFTTSSLFVSMKHGSIVWQGKYVNIIRIQI